MIWFYLMKEIINFTSVNVNIRDYIIPKKSALFRSIGNNLLYLMNCRFRTISFFDTENFCKLLIDLLTIILKSIIGLNFITKW